jgi:hypothetical protein
MYMYTHAPLHCKGNRVTKHNNCDYVRYNYTRDDVLLVWESSVSEYLLLHHTHTHTHTYPTSGNPVSKALFIAGTFSNYPQRHNTITQLVRLTANSGLVQTETTS